jgi:hypothetical protein
MADRDLAARFPEIELQQFAGTADGALIGPAAVEQRPDLAQVVIDDRLCDEHEIDVRASDARWPTRRSSPGMDMSVARERCGRRGPTRRLSFRSACARRWSAPAVAIVSWDKRGGATSTSERCPGERVHFEPLAAVVDEALCVLRAHATSTGDACGGALAFSDVRPLRPWSGRC